VGGDEAADHDVDEKQTRSGAEIKYGSFAAEEPSEAEEARRVAQ
jgi:hypothetical protein